MTRFGRHKRREDDAHAVGAALDTSAVEADPDLPTLDVVVDSLNEITDFSDYDEVDEAVGVGLAESTGAKAGLIREIGELIKRLRGQTAWSSRKILLAAGCSGEVHPRSAVDADEEKLRRLLEVLQTMSAVADDVLDTVGDRYLTGDALDKPSVIRSVKAGDVGQAYVEAMADKRVLAQPLRRVTP